MKAVVISAVWCPSCLIMIGRYHQLRDHYPQVTFLEYDYDSDKEAVVEYKVWKTLPVLILYDGAQEVARFIGEKSYKELASKLEALING